jgi:hypothetical protein
MMQDIADCTASHSLFVKSTQRILRTPFSLPKSDSTSFTTWLVRPPNSSSAFFGSSTCGQIRMNGT